jgi:Protein of unknown function (DUF2806)
MGDLLAKPLELYEATKNIFASVGSFLISQSDISSEAFERHNLRIANAEATKIFLIEEAKSIAAARDSLRKKQLDATPEERIRIRRDIEYSECDLRQLQTVFKAQDYLPKFTALPSNECTDKPQEKLSQPVISDHWIDRFNQLARSKNEEWRQDLLSRALAAEAANPGSICPRALWLIGTLEEEKFQAFTALLDVSSMIDRNYMIPSDNGFLLKIPSCDLGQDILIGQLTYHLNDTGLLADFTSRKRIGKDELLMLGYDQIDYSIECKEELTINGILPSTIGNSVAIFYERRVNLFGQQILNEWLTSLHPQVYKITKHYPDNGDLTIVCSESEQVA